MKFWYSRSIFAWLFLPLAGLFWLVSVIRRQLFRYGCFRSYRAKLPIVVVGNLSVGGNGKTPLTIWLVQHLQQLGYQVGIISRGYGAKTKDFPALVQANSSPELVGDEPVLLAQRTGVPVCISPNRQQSIELLTQQFALDVIISDDGLQHYALQRDIEIVVMDSQLGVGNGFLLPAGPLRELPSRLQQVDFVVANGQANPYSQFVMQLKPQYAINLRTQEKCLLSEFKQVAAIAGIGNPQRFFTMLQQLGLDLIKQQAFSDHHHFQWTDLSEQDKHIPLLMTEKDAVKCQSFAQANWWYVPVETQLMGDTQGLLAKIEQKIKDYQ
ncbi:tetraacyldisaccharide 4'-kinase [Volucribacter amazonae]|uniref:Tetraacyldisaccharide 4'-kinase n=1 Tax=Volucribacter amazonae TaxID=256731 RepID=A0A9X4SL23_9PAST|nr:tetraacyldisaccharide 4'-kinase [Volucribacter amazonae]MDG6894613.1 tetraacyldisaccharide 4'-kinase [Volucribacter amazonae]